MKTPKKVPVVVLNGFLGSGKTTLFRNLLAQSRKKSINTCAIVNDMSDLDVDGELIASAEIVEEKPDIYASIHSVVISSKNGIQQLDKALTKLLDEQHPELILLETSGSAHPMPLIEYFRHHERVQLNGMFALVDSLMLGHDYNYGASLIPEMQQSLAAGKRGTVNLLVEQILFCSHLILTKTDRIDESKNSEIVSNIQSVNPYVAVYAILFGKLEIESLLELEEYDYHRVAQLIKELKPVLELEKEEDRPYNLATRTINDDRPFHPQRLWDACHEHLDQRIYRSKGFFWLATRDKHSMLWNQAAGGINLEIIGSWRAGIVEDENHGLTDFEIEKLKEILRKETSRFGDRKCDLTVIGDESQVDQFTNALKGCFLTETEIEQWEAGYVFDDPWPKNIVRMK